MTDILFALLYRLHRVLLARRINVTVWDRDLSQAVDCLTCLIEYLAGRKERP
ncbi:MAG: hypothetical protein NTV58_14590 [Deltaproteobacteria bacterium]|nr:hypothetical protein [Deltaproteobacteria bacterium]